MRRLRSTRFGIFALVLAGMLVFGLAAATWGWGAQVRSGDRLVIASRQEIYDDLYLSGNEVSIDSTVAGDVFVAARKVVVTGVIEGDLVAIAREVVVKGEIDDDVRVLCQVVQLDEKAWVGDDFMSANYSLETKPKSMIHGDLLSAGGQGLLAGSVRGDLKAAYGAMQIDGDVSGNATLETGDSQDDGPQPTQFMPQPTTPMPTVPPGLTLGDKAHISGKLVYTSKRKADIAQGAKVKFGIVHKLPKVEKGEEEEAAPTAASWALDQVRRLVALALVGLLIVWLMPGWATAVGEKVKAKPMPSLGWGFVALLAFWAGVVAVLVATVILAILLGAATLGNLAAFIMTLGFLTEAVLIVGFALYVAFCGPTVISLLGGRWILGRKRPEAATERVVPFLAGIVILWVLTAIPILGVVASLAITLFGFGGLWLWSMEKLRKPADQALETGAAA